MEQLPTPPPPLHWYDGMLLLPEHFRYSFSRNDALTHYRAMVLNPYSWGILRLRFNMAALTTGFIEVSHVEGIFPDGTVIAYSATDSQEPLQLDLRSSAEQLRERPSRIWLALAASDEEELSTGYRRYRLGQRDVLTYGEHGQESSEVTILQPRVQLVLADALPARLVGIPIAEVAWEHEGLALTSYLPPLLHVELDSPLGGIIESIILRLREKAQQLVNRINNPQPGISELVIDEFKFYVASLTAQLPLLETLLASNTTHPWVLFNVLALVAGNVAALGTERIPPLFRPYNHSDVYASFDQLRRYILRMVTEAAIETYLRIPFQLEGTVFKAELKQQWRGSTFIVAAHPKPAVSQSDLQGWIEHAVIGTVSLLPSLKLRRVLGAGRRLVERIPEVVVSRGTVLYEIILDDDCAIFGEHLCIENHLRERSDHAPAELSLYVKVKV
ncbi:MAG: type VI secretion system baseplate subunit TssK [Chlorobi bacterium]|nr:type VI secretion system baseplate subunit TssK [Chlorobiota bacterium]